MSKFQLPPTGWIWTGIEDSKEHKIFLFRKNLMIEKVPESLEIKVSADTRYRFYVNGQSVSFGPCKGDAQVWYFETVDIAPFLKEGENSLAAEVLRLSHYRHGNHSIWRTSYPGFYIHSNEFVADATWKWREKESVNFIPEDSPRVYLDIFERALGDASLQGWLEPDFDLSDWKDAVPRTLFQLPRGTSPANLLPRPIPQMFESPTLLKSVKEIRQSTHNEIAWMGLIKDGSIILEPNSEHMIEFDAGELTTGFLDFRFSGGEKAQLDIMTAESYVYSDNLKTISGMPKKGNRIDSEKGVLQGFTDYYTVGGFGNEAVPEKYEPFWFRTFRFVQLKVKTKNKPLKIEHFSYRETGYPLEANTFVTTSDESLSSIWDISLRSLRRCMHETYEDCPFYEQLQYAMDARTQILFTYSISADDRMARRTIDDFHRSLRYDGLTNCCWPTVSPNVIPGFSLFYIMMIHDHMMYFGDKELVNRYFPTIEAILNFYDRHVNEQGLVNPMGGIIYTKPYWAFVDWTPQWERTSGVPDAIRQGPITMDSLLYAYTLDLAAELASYVGKAEQAVGYTERAIRIKEAVNKYCRDEAGIYLDGPGVFKYSQHSQVWAVLSGAASEENRTFILEKSLSEESWPKCSVAMAYYLFRALEMSDMYEKTEALWEPWREMVANHLTTCQENDVDVRSDCHAWGSLALYEIPSVTLGVRPAKPGYEEVLVKPNPGYLRSAKGSIMTPHGQVLVAWKKEDNGIKVDIQAPEGVKIVTK